MPKPDLSSDSISKYSTLHERGVILKDEHIDWVLFNVTMGMQDSYNWLSVPESYQTVNIISSSI